MRPRSPFTVRTNRRKHFGPLFAGDSLPNRRNGTATRANTETRSAWRTKGGLAILLTSMMFLLPSAVVRARATWNRPPKSRPTYPLPRLPRRTPPRRPTHRTTSSGPSSALGWGYSLIFLFLSFTLVALIVMNLLTARRENVCPMALVEAFEANVNERKLQEAYEMAKSDESFLGQVLSAGLAKLSAGYSQAIEAMQEVGEEENMKLEHRLSYMALIGTISPMIGLFGTVHGMINSFQVIATSPTAPKPAELAQGISTALFTTLIGLFIAIPAIAAYNIFRNRVSRLVLEVGILSENLMSRLEPLAGKAVLTVLKPSETPTMRFRRQKSASCQRRPDPDDRYVVSVDRLLHGDDQLHRGRPERENQVADQRVGKAARRSIRASDFHSVDEERERS